VSIGSVSVTVTPSSSGHNSRYDPFFRLPSSETPKTIAPVDMTGKSYAEKHAYKVYVEKFQKEQLAKQVTCTIVIVCKSLLPIAALPGNYMQLVIKRTIEYGAIQRCDEC
jgi:hypothetical protein